MKTYEATLYLVAQCNFAHQSPMAFMGVWRATLGKVCDTGCAEFNSGRCPAYRKLITEAPPTPRNNVEEQPGETVREEAARRGISINEVRRQRRGT